MMRLHPYCEIMDFCSHPSRSKANLVAGSVVLLGETSTGSLGSVVVGECRMGQVGQEEIEEMVPGECFARPSKDGDYRDEPLLVFL
jgi:hypothetical protein